MVADALRDYNRVAAELKTAADLKDALLAAHEGVRDIMKVPENERDDHHAELLEKHGKFYVSARAEVNFF